MDFAGPSLAKCSLKWSTHTPSGLRSSSCPLLQQQEPLLHSESCLQGMAYPNCWYLITDHNSCQEFKQFLTNNGVHNIHSSPYHPTTNGAAEHMVQTMKTALKVSHANGAKHDQALSTFLLSYRTIPHAVTGVTPSFLFMGRELRSRLRLLTPDIAAKVRSKQWQPLHTRLLNPLLRMRAG